jgi:hypothetical protein
MKILFKLAKDLCNRFEQVTILYVPREQNVEADRLANEALDAGVVGQ